MPRRQYRLFKSLRRCAKCLTPEFYRYLRELSLQWQFDFYWPQPLPANGIIAFDMDSTFTRKKV